jgi:hypothetical protein
MPPDAISARIAWSGKTPMEDVGASGLSVMAGLPSGMAA